MTAAAVHRRPVVLTCVEYYQPGYKAGGPLRSVAGMVDQLAAEFDFFILARDRDDGDNEPYEGIRSDSWVDVGNARVFYASSNGLKFRNLVRLIRSVNPDAIHLNGYFGRTAVRVMGAKRLGLLTAPLVVGPRGEFGNGALALKRLKKRSYLLLARAIGLHGGVSWHASTDLEADEIRRAVGTDSTVRVAPEIIRQRPPQPSAPKEVGRVRLIFASRITPKKNLAYLLQVLRKVRGEVILTIHGPIQHPDYWDRCKRLIDALPSNIQVTYEGPLTHERLQARLQSCHFVALPTLSENFGHVIIEAMLAGRPVIISDATPWRELAASGAGWDLPIGLAAEETWCEVIDRCVQMDDAVYRRMSTSANEHATRWIGEAGAPGLHRDMFNMVMSA